jgi:hypothetical protein
MGGDAMSIWWLIACAIVLGILAGVALVSLFAGPPELAERDARRHAKPKGNVDRL